MVGLDAAGKTTILYKLKLGEIVTTIPTIGTSFVPRPPGFGSRHTTESTSVQLPIPTHSYIFMN